MKIFFCVLMMLLPSHPAFSAHPPATVSRKTLKLGSLEFDVMANVRAFDTVGVARSLNGYMDFDGTKMRKLQVSVPVESLTTGMGIRDRHMREQIFQTKDGKLPPLLLTAAETECKTTAWDPVCPIHGKLEIQGITRPFNAKVQLTQTDGGYEAKGECMVKLSDYGIPRPHELGIKTADEVMIKFDLKAE